MTDPFLSLGLPETADDAQIKEAYQEKLRQNPENELALRVARSFVDNAEKRTFEAIIGTVHKGSVEDLFPRMPLQARPVGIDTWLKLIDETAP